MVGNNHQSLLASGKEDDIEINLDYSPPASGRHLTF